MAPNTSAAARMAASMQSPMMMYCLALREDVYKRQSLDSISDELAIYAGIDASPEELEEVVKIIQDFDPAGLGARTRCV